MPDQTVQPCTPPPRAGRHMFAGLASSPENPTMDGAHETLCPSTEIVSQTREASVCLIPGAPVLT